MKAGNQIHSQPGQSGVNCIPRAYSPATQAHFLLKCQESAYSSIGSHPTHSVLLEQQLNACSGTFKSTRAQELVPVAKGSHLRVPRLPLARDWGVIEIYSQRLTFPVTCREDPSMCQEHPITFVLIPMTCSVSHGRNL